MATSNKSWHHNFVQISKVNLLKMQMVLSVSFNNYVFQFRSHIYVCTYIGLYLSTKYQPFLTKLVLFLEDFHSDPSMEMHQLIPLFPPKLAGLHRFVKNRSACEKSKQSRGEKIPGLLQGRLTRCKCRAYTFPSHTKSRLENEWVPVLKTRAPEIAPLTSHEPVFLHGLVLS